MQIKSEFDLQTSDSANSRLAAAFQVDESELPGLLSKVAQAATREFIDMVLGTADTTRASSVREHRLVLLAEHAFVGVLPSEAVVAKLFRCTRSQARTLINGVLAHYDYRVGDGLRRTCVDAINEAVKLTTGAGYELPVTSKYIVEALNQRLQRIDPTLPRIRPKAGTSSTYLLDESTKDALVKDLAA